MCSKIEKIFLIFYKKKEAKLLDIYFSKLFKNKNIFESDVCMLFAFLLSISRRLGHICIPINRILSKDFFSYNIYIFLNYFFSSYININDSINILFKNKIISFYFNNYKTPFILYYNCIYFYKFWFYENKVVSFLKINLIKQYKFNRKEILNILFFLKKFNLDIYHKLSILNVIYNKISIISGKPGTGKTTLISKLIIILYKLFKFNSRNSIVIVSYTGKSSSNITYSLKKNYSLLNISKSIIDILPNKVITIHKFLKLNYNKKESNIKDNILLDFNILIVDEFSMIDLPMLYYMFSIIKNNFLKIVFLGDSNQIGPIDTFSIFNEICSYNFSLFSNKNIVLFLLKYNFNFLKYNININNLNNNVLFLIKNYRFGKNLFLNNFFNLIILGKYNEIEKFIYKNNFKFNFNFYDSNIYNYNFFLDLCVKEYKYYIDIINNDFNFNNFFLNFNKFQIISIFKVKYFGINYLNEYVNNFFLNNLIDKKIIKYNNIFYYNGLPIIFTKNDDDLNLFNGDIGFININDSTIKVFISDKKNNFRTIYLNDYLFWDYTWSITVHKSQGSEYDHVLLVIPNYFTNLLNKELIYTGLTRAKTKISVYSDLDIFLNSIKKNNIKYNNFINKFL